MLLYDARKKVNKGFTLLEMITVVIIVGVIASIAAPNLLGMLNQTRVKDAIGKVEGAIREAQKLAIRRGKACTITFTKTTGTDAHAVAQVAAGSDGCLLSTREFESEITLEFETEDAVTGTKTKTTIDSTNPLDIVFSGKGNTNTASEGTIIVSRTATNTQKCLQIEGLLGNIITGDYVDTDADDIADDCDAK